MPVHASLLSYRAANAALGWAVIAVLLALTVERTRAGELLWAGMAAAAIAVGLVPAAVSRRPSKVVAWEVLAVAALPVAGRSVGVLVGPMAYLSVAALALVVAVELDAYTSVEMTADFAVAFVVVVTMAIAGVWTIARYVSDSYLGTTLLASENTLTWDLVLATVVGVGAGIVFEPYFRRLRPSRTITREPRRPA